MNTTKEKQLWKQEHPKANVPALISDHAELTDMSWHNDACPSFTLKGYEGGQKDFRLWVDYEDKNLSDIYGSDESLPYHRFMVSFQDWDTNEAMDAYRGSDAVEAIATLKKLIADKG